LATWDLKDYFAPPLNREELATLNPPEVTGGDVAGSIGKVFKWIKDIDNVKRVGQVLTSYSSQYYWNIMAAYVTTYIL